MNKVYNCPVLDWECPYFNPEGCVCKLDDPKQIVMITMPQSVMRRMMTNDG